MNLPRRSNIVMGDLLDKGRHIHVCYTGDKLLAQ